MALEKYPLGQAIIGLVAAHRAVTTTKISKIGLHAGQDLILLALLETDGQSQNELVKNLCANHSAIAKSVGRLQKNEIVRTEKSAADRRITRVFLTDKGRDLAQQAQAIWQNVEELAVQGLSADEQQAFQHLMTSVTQNFMAATRAAE